MSEPKTIRMRPAGRWQSLSPAERVLYKHIGAEGLDAIRCLATRVPADELVREVAEAVGKIVSKDRAAMAREGVISAEEAARLDAADGFADPSGSPGLAETADRLQVVIRTLGDAAGSRVAEIGDHELAKGLADACRAYERRQAGRG